MQLLLTNGRALLRPYNSYLLPRLSLQGHFLESKSHGTQWSAHLSKPAEDCIDLCTLSRKDGVNCVCVFLSIIIYPR